MTVTLPSEDAPLVERGWLAAHAGEVTVVDCRFDLVEPARARAAAYLERHIAGAAYLALDADLSDMSRAPAAGRHPLPTGDAFAAAARRAGIDASRPVVAYDEAMTGGAARLWWLLTHFGHPQVGVLQGGLTAWEGPTAAGEERIAPGDFTAGPGVRSVVELDEVARRVPSGELTLLDARDAARFGGAEAVGPLAGADPRTGHVPGATSLPWQDVVRDGVPSTVLQAGPLAASCGSGVTACILLLELERAGRTDAALYPGSWSEWARSGEPVSTDPA